jgi:hypothetical protein
MSLAHADCPSPNKMEDAVNTVERETLTRFLQALVQARPASKDLEAERLIRENCNYQPDASYLLVQRALLLEEALRKAEAENLRLQNELADARGTGGVFLNDTAWGNSRQGAPQPAAAAAPAVAGKEAAPAQAAAGHGFLGSAATTAAGVVAGAFLFQGIERLMGQERGSGFIGRDVTAPDRLVDNDLSDPTQFDAGDGLSSLIPSDNDLDSL